MNGFKCTFHDLRHTFATMMIGNGCNVRTVASYLGHASVPTTLDIYADVGPETTRAAVDKVGDSFNMDMSGIGFDEPERPVAASAGGLTFTVEQLRAMITDAEHAGA